MFFRQSFSLPAMIVLTALPLVGQEAIKCTSKELPDHPFMLNGISVRISELIGYKIFDRDRKFSGRARVSLFLENKGPKFQDFDPQALSFVGRDGAQVFPIFERNLSDETIPMAIHLAPGAHVSKEYALTGRLTFPARIYLGSVWVAEVPE